MTLLWPVGSFRGLRRKAFISVGVLGMYVYLGKVSLGHLSGCLRLLGRRLYIKMGWRPRETCFLGNLGDPLSIAVRLRRLAPRPMERRAAAVIARALAASLYVARRCRDSPRWRVRAWEAESLLLDAASALA